jgi:hypothetical protein
MGVLIITVLPRVRLDYSTLYTREAARFLPHTSSYQGTGIRRRMRVECSETDPVSGNEMGMNCVVVN